ncbi:MAG: (Fe-S)-binding protein [Coriobacteriia bacterium]|nr:(Fe-S)-binding protein [Coriobacteriia bacterium]
MSAAHNKLKPQNIARSAMILSPVEQLAPLPAPYDTCDKVPEFTELKPDWIDTRCASLDGFVAIDSLRRPASPEDEEEFVRSFIVAVGKLFAHHNSKFLRPLNLTVDYCAKCDTCSQACHVYQATCKQDIYRPIYRSEVLRRIYKKHYTTSGKLLGSFVGAGIDLTWESIARLAELAYRCNLCRRCAQVCPLGLDNGMLAREIRKLFSQEMGIAPSAIHEKGSMLHLNVGSTTGLTRPALLDTIEFLEEDMSELTGRKVRFPIDKEGADVLLLHNAGEFLTWPENPTAFAILFDEAGIDWTLSSESLGYDGVNYGLWYDDTQARKIALTHAGIAKKLGVSRIVIGECGHAHKALAVSANRMTSEVGVPVESNISVLAELVREGRLVFDSSKNDFPIALHDPCNVVRQMGIVKPQRDILKAIAPQFLELTPEGVNNYCCGGGSGFALMHSGNFEDFKVKVCARTKFTQIIDAFGKDFIDPALPKYVCAPCSNCKGTMRDLFKHYKTTATYQVHYGGLVELMVNALASTKTPYLEFLQ